MKNTIKIVFVIIASLIGAGFASGKEIYAFFFIYGKCGICGIILSNFLISLVIYKILLICKNNNVKSYSQFCNLLIKENKFLSYVLNNIVSFFLLISFGIMIAGFASLFNQEFNINKMIGVIIIIVINYYFSIKKTEGVVKLSNALIPVFLIFLLVINIKNKNVLNLLFYILNNDNGNIYYLTFDNWLIKSVLYASYNCVIITPIVVIIAEKANDRKSILSASAINFFILSFFSFIIFSLLLDGSSYLYSLEMPAVAIASKYGNLYKNIYIAFILISIITSVVSASVSFLNNVSKSSGRYNMNLISISVFAILISRINFGLLITYLYPSLGVLGVCEVLSILLLKNTCKKNKKLI